MQCQHAKEKSKGMRSTPSRQCVADVAGRGTDSGLDAHSLKQQWKCKVMNQSIKAVHWAQDSDAPTCSFGGCGGSLTLGRLGERDGPGESTAISSQQPLADGCQ